MNALAFSGINFLFGRITDHGEKEHKRHDLALKEFQKARDKWNEDRMKQHDFISKSLREKNEIRAYINNADQAMIEYYQVFSKQIKSLVHEPQLSDFYLPSEKH